MDQKWIDDLVDVCTKTDMFKTTGQRIEEFVKKTKVCQTNFAKGNITIDHVEDWCARNGVRLIQDANLTEPCSSLWLCPSRPDNLPGSRRETKDLECIHEKCLRCNACVDGAGNTWKTPGPKGKFICGDCMYSKNSKKNHVPTSYVPGSCPPLDCGRPKNSTKKKETPQKDIVEKDKVTKKKTGTLEQPRYKINFYTDAGGCSLDEEEYTKTTKGVKRAIYEFAKSESYLFCCYGLHIDITGKGKDIKLSTDDGTKCPIQTKVTKEGKVAKDKERVENALFGKDGEVILEKEDMSRLKLKFKRGYIVDYTFDWSFLEN